MKRVTSRHHPLVAACRALARRRDPGGGRMLLDGLHLVQDARRAGLAFEAVALNRSTLGLPEVAALAEALARDGAEVVEVTDAVLEAMSPVSTPSGIVAIGQRPDWPLDRVVGGSSRPLIVVAVDVQDPGNVGAIARAAEAGGASALVLCGASADPFGWKALRGSMGSLLRLPTASVAAWHGALDTIRARGVRVAATVPRGGVPLFEANLARPLALLLGGEGPGLPPEAVEAADVRVSIPMRGPVESLNVAVAAALLVYESARRETGGGDA
jgi:RNA methyltransferase, TrmH family